jgi:hypothetical protein
MHKYILLTSLVAITRTTLGSSTPQISTKLHGRHLRRNVSVRGPGAREAARGRRCILAVRLTAQVVGGRPRLGAAAGTHEAVGHRGGRGGDAGGPQGHAVGAVGVAQELSVRLISHGGI